MLEHVPQWLGSMLRNVRAGHAKLAIAQDGLVPSGAWMDLSSPAFGQDARLPVRFTADGEGVSPPLVWGPAPAGTVSFALLVEDPDAPALSPLVHAILWGISPGEHGLAEGAFSSGVEGSVHDPDIGRNSFFGRGWLPPDPPAGHGNHDYVFQLFALSDTAELGTSPGRSEVVDALEGRVLAAGLLVGTYSRGEDAPVTGAAPSGAIG